MADPWIRNGTVTAVGDGDSCKVLVDLGYRVLHQTTIRLLGIDAPERGEPGWAEARDCLGRLLPLGLLVTVHTTGPDKYGGRWLGDVILADGTSVAQAMLASGLAVPYDGGART